MIYLMAWAFSVPIWAFIGAAYVHRKRFALGYAPAMDRAAGITMFGITITGVIITFIAII